MYGGAASMGVLRNKSSVVKVRVLVVDDDSTCLNVIAGILKFFGYEVATAQDPLEALSTMYEKLQTFDLVLSDVHMPIMNGIELQRHIQKEFKIPVILMSGDDERSTIMQGLKQGVEFFILKPPKIHELENLWQYAISKSNNQSEKAPDSIERSISCMGMLVKNSNDDELHSLPSSKTEESLCLNRHNKQDPITIPEDVEDIEIESKSVSTNSKKPKRLVWTTALHNKFLDAVNIMGIDNAIPTKILEYMNVPGLTRANVASHLQKYRIYTRKLQQERKGLFRSAFSWSEFPSLATNNFMLNLSNARNQVQPQPMQLQPMQLQPMQQQPMPHLTTPSFAGPQFLLNNTQANNFVYPINNIGGNNFPNQMNILESSRAGGQSSFNSTNTGFNNQVVHNNLGNMGDLGTVAMQFLSSNKLPPSNVNYQQVTTMPTQKGSGVGQSSGSQAAGLSTNGYLDDLPLMDDDEFWNLPLPRDERGGSIFNNNGVALHDNNTFNGNTIQQGINQLQLQESVVTNVDPIAENHQVAVQQQAVNTSNLENFIPFAQQMPAVEKNVNDTIQVTGRIEPNQEMSNIDWACGSPSAYQDFTSLNLDDLSLDRIEDLFGGFSSNDAKNGNNNKMT